MEEQSRLILSLRDLLLVLFQTLELVVHSIFQQRPGNLAG